ncbi:MAG: amidohydrolase [Pirellulales bacterium]|nr:amidohydrolase [Pirellulales bacterium]
MSYHEVMHRIDALVSHVWMVRTFIKHSEELEDDPELSDVQRTLYDYMLALGAAWKAQDAEAYIAQAKKKLSKLRQATDDFARLQPEVSTHMNYQMALRSLQHAVKDIETLLGADD